LAWIAREQQRRAQESDKTNRQLYYVVNLNLAQIAFNEGNYIRSQELLNEFLPSASQSAKQDIRSFAWYYLWRLNHDEKITLKGHGGSVSSVAFAPDGRLLASGSGDGTVKLWDVQTQREVATLKGHGGSGTSVVFAPDGRLLASGSEDGTVQLWIGATDAEVAAQRNE
jgi:WD40 repeat protein